MRVVKTILPGTTAISLSRFLFYTCNSIAFFSVRIPIAHPSSRIALGWSIALKEENNGRGKPHDMVIRAQEQLSLYPNTVGGSQSLTFDEERNSPLP